MKFDESKHPRADDGRFTKCNEYRQSKRDYSNVLKDIDKEQKNTTFSDRQTKIEKSNAFINTQLFAARIKNQSHKELFKSKKSFERRIAEHQSKINNPEMIYSDWTNTSEETKQGRINHWKKEVAEFNKRLIEIEERLKE